jgi:hypothetical protein
LPQKSNTWSSQRPLRLCGSIFLKKNNHRGAEDAEVTQRKLKGDTFEAKLPAVNICRRSAYNAFRRTKHGNSGST